MQHTFSRHAAWDPHIVHGREYRGTSLIINHPPLGPYRRPMPRFIGEYHGGGRLLMSEVPLNMVAMLISTRETRTFAPWICEHPHRDCVQGYLAHKRQPPPLGPP